MRKHWKAVKECLETAYSIAWDECHKIYVLMDKEEHDKMIGYGYENLIRVKDPLQSYETLQKWYSQSCALKFISSVRTVDTDDPNDGFSTLIPQF